MLQVRRNEVLTKANPKLTITLSSGGSPVIPTELFYAVFEINSPEKVISPIKIYPVTLDKEPVDIFGSDRISDGNYAAQFTFPHTATLGRMKIVWYFKTFAGQTSYTEFIEEFESIDYVDVYGSEGPPLISINDVRTFLKDKPKYHVLINDYLFTDFEIMAAADYTVSKFNIMPPPIGNYTIENFPNDFILLTGMCGWLFDMESNIQLQEQLSYQDGNTHHGLSDKTQLYRQAATYYKNEFTQMASDLKMQINMNNVYGGEGVGVWFLQSRSRLRGVRYR